MAALRRKRGFDRPGYRDEAITACRVLRDGMDACVLKAIDDDAVIACLEQKLPKEPPVLVRPDD